MNDNFDPLFDKYVDMDFSNAKPVSEIPHLVKLQAQFAAEKNKKEITISYDAEIISAFKATGKDWQNRMNDALKEWLNQHPDLSRI
jgi:uncharacterized protein (DUF4415 family)